MVKSEQDEMLNCIRQLRSAIVAMLEAKGEQKMADALLKAQVAMFNSSDYRE